MALDRITVSFHAKLRPGARPALLAINYLRALFGCSIWVPSWAFSIRVEPCKTNA